MPDAPPDSDRASDAAPGPFVEAEYAGGRVRRHPLADRKHVVGRAAEADLCLDDPSVSRRHAELEPGPTGWTIRDLGSRNGTRVNGRDVGDLRVPVGPADQIEVGSIVLSLSPAAGKPPPAGRSRRGVSLRDDSATEVLALTDMASPAVGAHHLRTLLDLGDELLATADPAGRLRALCRHLVDPAYGGRYAAVLRVWPDRPDTAEPLCEAGRDAGGPYVSRTVLRAAAARGEAVLATNRTDGGLVDLSVSVDASVLAVAVIACPLHTPLTAALLAPPRLAASARAAAAAGPSAGPVTLPAAPTDLLYVVLPPGHGTGEWLALAGLAGRQHQQAEAAWAARRQAEVHAGFERELGRAREIQTRLLPANRPPMAGVDAAFGFVPCHAVGGDYLDVVAAAGRVWLAVADVCGKGLSAALVTAGLHTIVRGGAAAGLELCDLMNHLNRHLCQTLPPEVFVTMFAAVLDPATGRLECANAGHPPPFVLPADGGPARPLDVESSLPLGLDPDPVACEVRMLGRGDGLFLYTDGLSEMTGADGGMIRVAGVGRLIEAAWRPADATARDAADALTRLLDELQADGPPADDRTFLLARWL
jgi:sigma-B regulation protein RsbU (phosphoserine phosphatase)